MLFFGNGRQRATDRKLAPYENFVRKKIAPNFSLQSDLIFESAIKSFPKGIYENGAKLDLIAYGQSTVNMVAVSLAEVARNAMGRELADIEYGDCALAAQFLQRIPLRSFDEAADDIFGHWISAFETDLKYLVYADENVSISDLIEQGHESYLQYENHEDAKLPAAYFYIFAKVLLQRQRGDLEPYRLLDPMIGPNPILLASLENAWLDIGSMIQNWMDTVQGVQDEANQNGLEVWSWW